jgi:hypothetical protein
MQNMTPTAISLEQATDIIGECRDADVTQEKVGESLVTTAQHPKHGLMYFIDSALAKIVLLTSSPALAAQVA